MDAETVDRPSEAHLFGECRDAIRTLQGLYALRVLQKRCRSVEEMKAVLEEHIQNWEQSLAAKEAAWRERE